jgi:hypothetical protein
MKIIYKVHLVQEQLILALCDEELIGKVFESGDIVLDLDKFKNFYMGEFLDKKDAKRLIDECDSINAVGYNSIKLILELGYAKKEDIKMIANAPHLQIYKIYKQ